MSSQAPLSQQTPPIFSEPQYKLIWYAPDSDLESTKTAVFNAGAGGIGLYSHCAFQSKGTGQFQPLEGANPTLGAINLLEKVEEWKIEVLVPESKARKVIKALIKAHSYEEPAYELIRIYTLQDFPGDTSDDEQEEAK